MIDTTPHDDVELGDLENDAFLPGQENGGLKKGYSSPSILTRWMPQRLKAFVENLSRLKVGYLLLLLRVEAESRV